MGIIALSSLIIAGTGVFLATRVLANLPPGEKKVQQDIAKLREQLSKAVGGLLRLKGEDLELMAAAAGKTRKEKGFKKVQFGTLRTIFDEPVVEYAKRDYSAGSEMLVVANTVDHEIILWKQKKKGTRLVIDNAFVGIINDERHLMGGKKGEELIAVLKDSPEGLEALYVAGRELANLKQVSARKTQDLQIRLFELIMHPLSEREAMLLWAMIIYDLLIYDELPVAQG